MKMCARWVFLFYVLYIQLYTTNSNYYDSNQYSDEPEDMRDAAEYEDEGNFEYVHQMRKYNHKDLYNRAGSEECQCSCQICKKPNPQPCCREVCYYCMQTDVSYPTQRPENPNLVFVPYPVPLVVPNVYKNNTSKSDAANTTKEPATTKAVTTTKAPTTTTKSELRANSLEEMITGHHRTMKELNPGAKSKIRPAWVPKYGIVPIPDHLAAKLMSQLIETRALKNKRRF